MCFLLCANDWFIFSCPRIRPGEIGTEVRSKGWLHILGRLVQPFIGSLSGTPDGVATLRLRPLETGVGAFEPFDIVIGEVSVLLSVPGSAQPEIAEEVIGYASFDHLFGEGVKAP